MSRTVTKKSEKIFTTHKFVCLRACLPSSKIKNMKTMKLETYVGYMLRREVTTQEAAEATGYSRNAFSSHSRKGTLDNERIERAFDYWRDEAAELGIELNLTNALIEMGYIPAPTQDFNQASSLTATTTRRKATTAKPKHDLSEYGY